MLGGWAAGLIPSLFAACQGIKGERGYAGSPGEKGESVSTGVLLPSERGGGRKGFKWLVPARPPPPPLPPPGELPSRPVNARHDPSFPAP